jgi:hypothetical protein
MYILRKAFDRNSLFKMRRLSYFQFRAKRDHSGVKSETRAPNGKVKYSFI